MPSVNKTLEHMELSGFATLLAAVIYRKRGRLDERIRNYTLRADPYISKYTLICQLQDMIANC